MARRVPPPVRVVLDTSCVRGTPRAHLEALRASGVRLEVSTLAVDELAVRIVHAPPMGETPDRRGALRARMRFLGQLLGPPFPIAPTHAFLVERRGGTWGPRMGYDVYEHNMRAAWAALASEEPMAPDVADYVRKIASYVTETGADYMETQERMAAFGAPTPQDVEMMRRFGHMIPSALDAVHMPGPPTVRERFDLYTRLCDLRPFTAHHRARGQLSKAEENDAIDVNLTHHVADGAILATRDYRFLEEVDATNSPQAPWVRTVGELLAGRIPSGPPFGLSARNAAKRHRPRKRAELVELDQVRRG